MITYRLVRSSRKSIGLEIRDGELLVRAPYFATKSEIERVIREKSIWIEKHLAESRRRKESAEQIEPLTRSELEELAQKALEYIPERAAYYAKILGVRYNRITIRNQRTRWGSCSAKGNLNFNCILMLTPPEAIDSVVVHELCHLKHMNHSKAFYQEIEKVFPDYDQWHRWLKANQPQLMARLGPARVE